MALSLSHHRDADTVTVVVVGDVDLGTAEDLERAVLEAVTGDVRAVVVDLAGVEFLDSAGINVLLKGRRMADAHQRAYRVVNMSGLVAEVLTMTGVGTHLAGEVT